MRGFFYPLINSSSVVCSDCTSEGFLASTNFLNPRRPVPIPTNIIDCDITSTDEEINILSIHPSKKQKLPTIHIIIPQKAVPEVLPSPFENSSDQENLDKLGFIPYSLFFTIYKA